MKLSALIIAVGDDNVQFQNLDQCAKSLDWSRKAGGSITFVTPQTIIPGEGTQRLGLVVWLDREAAAAAIKADAASPARGPSHRLDAINPSPQPRIAPDPEPSGAVER